MAYRRTPAVEERLAEVRERIAQAGLSLVSERGYSGCSVADVAVRAGVGTGTVYRYFPSKGDLFAEVFRTACAREVAAARVAGESASGCACLVLVAAIETFASRALQAPRLAYALLAEPVDPLVDVERLAFRQSYRDLFSVSIAEGVRSGAFPDQDPDVTAAALVGAVSEALVAPLARGTHDADCNLIRSLIDFTQRSLGASHAHA